MTSAPAPGPTPGPVHLVVGTPCQGGLCANLFATSLLALQHACAARGIGFEALLPGGDALVTRARNELVAEFLHRPHATHLMFIDADIGFAPDSVLRLLAFGAPVAGAPYPLRTLDRAGARAAAASGRDPVAGAMRYVGGPAAPAGPNAPARNGFAPARVLGGGFMMVRRAVFETMRDAYPALRYRHVHASPDPRAGSPHRHAFFDTMIDQNGAYLPEDYAFCRRWTALGGEIWTDTEARLVHQGSYAFVGDPCHVPDGHPRPAASDPA